MGCVLAGSGMLARLWVGDGGARAWWHWRCPSHLVALEVPRASGGPNQATSLCPMPCPSLWMLRFWGTEHPQHCPNTVPHLLSLPTTSDAPHPGCFLGSHLPAPQPLRSPREHRGPSLPPAPPPAETLFPQKRGLEAIWRLSPVNEAASPAEPALVDELDALLEMLHPAGREAAE